MGAVSVFGLPLRTPKSPHSCKKPGRLYGPARKLSLRDKKLFKFYFGNYFTKTFLPPRI